MPATLRIYAREEWGARYGDGVKTSGARSRVVVHHAHIPHVDCGEGVQAEMKALRGIEHFQAVTRGWGRFSYNFAIFQSGNVYEGLGWLRIGAHAAGVNSSSHGVIFVIDGNVYEPSTAAWESARELVALGVRLGHIAPLYDVSGHRDHTEGRSCPGDRVYAHLARLLPDAGPVTPVSPPARPVLRYGDTGEAVRGLQGHLNRHGHGPRLPLTGNFLSMTRAAVLGFQRANGLHPDGVVGNNTWGKLLD